MADSEFEEFRHHFDSVPQHIKATAQTYTLVHDILLEDSPTSSKSDSDDNIGEKLYEKTQSLEEVDLLPRKRCETREDSAETIEQDWPKESPPQITRRRRKLPEIPKNKKSHVMSLAEELGNALSIELEYGKPHPRNLLMLKYLRDEDIYGTDVDSGHSTSHSPDGPKSSSPLLCHHTEGSVTPVSEECSSYPYPQLELLEATHRGLHKFIPRHRDEVEIEIGDPIYVQKEADDFWCEGVNLRTGQHGIFPSAYAVDMDYNDFDPSTPKVKRERFLLGYLGSVETLCHKGTSVLCQAVKKITDSKHKPHQCILEISDQGLRMVDKSKKKKTINGPCLDYFYSLKNVSFCAFHPRDHRYMGFITKHPALQRFACHVFLGCESTRPVAEAIGRAFERFYNKFIETAYPIEDIYIE